MAPEASAAVTKEASELQSQPPGEDSELPSLSAASGQARRLEGPGLAFRSRSLLSLLPSPVQSSITRGDPEGLASSFFPLRAEPGAEDESWGQRAGWGKPEMGVGSAAGGWSLREKRE